MSEERDRPLSIDPFLADDPEAIERERRRQQREARRRARSENRKSLGERVSGALDGAATKGREALEQTKERARNREAPASAPEPPPFRRPRAAPPPAAEPSADDAADAVGPGDRPAVAESPVAGGEPDRYTAEELMPRRPSRRPAPASPPPADSPPADPPPAAGAAPSAGEDDRLVDADPPPAPPRRGALATGGYPPPPTTTPPEPGKTYFFRRLLALALLLFVAIAIYGLVSRGGGESTPAPKGPATLKTEDVTIPEGYTRAQIATVAKDAGLSGDYEKATAKAPKGFDIAKTGAPKDVSLEGFLFPATYELAKGASVDDLVTDQLNAFDDNIGQVDLKAAEKKNLTTYDVVIIASMIEREVMVPKERPLVAAVIYNRLAQGIPLGIDATLRYELNNFDKPLTQSDLETQSPYNTRLVTGLPPTPIANPGLDSLQAAADPAGVDYLYYVVKPGTCGKHFFTADYDEFLAASEKYNSAREAQGGSPTDC